MPFALGVRVWIEVEGSALSEFKIQVERRRTTCFIPSQEGKKFSVRFQNVQPAMSALRGNIYLDGIASGAGLLLASDVHATSISGHTRWEGLESPFQFARLRTTDDESQACQDETRLRELGTVQIEWVEVVRQELWRPTSTPISSTQPIHERSKKASAHCTSLGDVVISRPKNWYSTTRLPLVEPMEFVFKYAPLDWLQAQDIVPAPPAQVSSHAGRRRQRSDTDEPEVMISELLDEEEAAVYQRLRAKMADRQNNKRRRTIKQEPGIAPKMPSTDPPEVIDLTGDD